MKIRILIYLLIAIILTSFDIKRTYSTQEPFFLETARSIAMGNAHTSFAALSYNPAGLADIRCKTISIHGALQKYSWLSIVKFSSICASLSYVQPHWGISLSRVETGDPEELLGADETLKPVPMNEKWLFQEQFLSIGYGRKILERLAFGLSLKYHHSGADTKFIESDILKEKNGLSLDIGLLYHINKKVSFGLTAKNIVHSKFDYIVLDYFASIALLNDLPAILNFGIDYEPIKMIKLAFEVHNLFEDEIQDHNRNVLYRFNRSFHFGSEFKFMQKLFWRFGFMIEELPVDFPTNIETPLTYKSKFTVTSGIGLTINHIFLNLAIDFDQRKGEFEKYQLSVTGNTFRYFVSFGWLF